MTLKSILSIILVLSFTFCIGQTNRNNVWKFGANGAGLDFENCSPIVLLNGVDNGVPFEGQSAISDELTGDLLFYTDGYNIYNSANQIMENGSGAGLSNSCTQTIIIKKPQSSSIFYMFTTDVQGGLVYNTNYPNARGINYAVVNMSLDNGLGSVVSEFNSLKDTSNCEQLTAVYHSNGEDIWLIGHEYGNNNFYSFLITDLGINPIPIISSTGPIIYTWQTGTAGNSNLDAIGELKASPNGNNLAFTTFYNGTTCLFDFENSTGIVSNPIPLTIEAGGYGVSFSPDNQKLYISGVDTMSGIPSFPSNGSIYQFDISSTNADTIQNTRTTIFNDPAGMFRSMKLGSDEAIYVARGNNSDYVGKINNPNAVGTTCDYVHDGLYLEGLQGRWGLNNAIEYSVFCSPATVSNVNKTNNVSVYPNPFGDHLNVKSDNKNVKAICFFDIHGRKVQQAIITQDTILNTKMLDEGTYFYVLYDDNDGSSSRGVVVKK